MTADRRSAGRRQAFSAATETRRGAMAKGASWLFAALLLALSAAPGRSVDGLTPLPVVEIASGVFVHQAPYALARPENAGAIANAGFVIGRDAVAVIDTEGSHAAGRRLLAAVRVRTSLPVRYVINTHVHPDHMLGNAAFEAEGAVFVGHRNLPEALAARSESYLAATRRLIGDDAFAGTRIVSPTRIVADKAELDLGRRRLLVEAWPTAHANSDLTVFDEDTGTWFLGDLLFAGHVPALDGKLIGWLETLRSLTARHAARVVPGHGPAAMPWPDAARPIERYLRRLETDIRAMIREGKTMQDAAAHAGRSESAAWALFDDFNARNATAAYHELEWE